MANFNRGGQSAKEAAKEQAAHSGFHRTNFFRLADGESATIRLIDDHDEWIWIHQHGGIPTKGTPPDFKSESGKDWPPKMGAVCRKSKTVDKDLVFPEFGGECFICDEMINPQAKRGNRYTSSIRLWARAILREEIRGTKAMVKSAEQPDGIEPHEVGTVIGYRDVETEVEELDDQGEPTGKTITVPEVVVLNFGLKNFFGRLQACAKAYGTILDRDYQVTREGKDKETDYPIIALERIFNENGKPYTLADPKVREPYLKLVDLEAEIERQASDDYYDRFFDTRHPFPTREDKDEEKAEQAPKAAPKQRVAKPQQEPVSYDGDAAGGVAAEDDVPPVTETASRMEEMRSRLRNVSKAAD